MDKDQFDGLMALKLVAEYKSFTAAAGELNISAPAVSKIISQLEEKMGVTLLTRTTRTVRLSEAGEMFLHHAGPAMDTIIQAQENARSFGLKPSGTLRINTPSIFYQHYLIEFVNSFLKQYPDITLEVYADDQSTDIFENGFDAGVREDDNLAQDMIAFKLFGPINFLTVASPEYLKGKVEIKHPKDLLEHNCIRLRFGASSRLYEKWEYQDKGEDFTVKVDGNLILNNAEDLRHAALANAGLIFTEGQNVAKEIRKRKPT